MSGICRCMGDRCRAKTCFIGKNSSGKPEADGLSDGISCNASGSGYRRTGRRKDQVKCFRQPVRPKDQYQYGTAQIAKRQKRNHEFGNSGNAAYSSDDDQANRKSSQKTGEPAWKGKQLVCGQRNSVGLSHISHAEGGSDTQTAENDSQGLGAYSFFHIIHRAAKIASSPFLPVANGQKNLSIFRHHAEKRTDPHPEYRAGAA